MKLNGVSDKVGYTGHAYDEETSYTYMQARFYDAQVGRFLSTDPVDDDFNLYAYVKNDPLNATDPTGQFCESIATCTMQQDDEAFLSGEMTSSEHRERAEARAVGAAAGVAVVVTGNPRVLGVILKGVVKNEAKPGGPTRQNISQKIDHLQKERAALEKGFEGGSGTTRQWPQSSGEGKERGARTKSAWTG